MVASSSKLTQVKKNSRPVESQKGLITRHLHTQLDPFASKLTNFMSSYMDVNEMIGVLGHDAAL